MVVDVNSSESSVAASMQTRQTKQIRNTLSPIQVGLLTGAGLLAVLVQILSLMAFFNSTRTATDFKNASVATTNLANIQREVLLLDLETNQYLEDPAASREKLDLRRALLSNQLRIQAAQGVTNPAIPQGINSVYESLKRFNILMAGVDPVSGYEKQIVAAELRGILSEMGSQVKGTYDAEEQSFFRAISVALQVQRSSQVLLLLVSALVILLGFVLTISLRRTVQALRNEMVQRQKAEYDPYLPEILVDGEQLQRVFINLAVNSREAMHDGGELRIRTQLKNEFVEVAFCDNGPGIPREVIDKIFDPLFTTKTKGTGLGLANCHQIVSRHGGSILVDSRPSKGTTFTVRLPLSGHASEESVK